MNKEKDGISRRGFMAASLGLLATASINDVVTGMIPDGSEEVSDQVKAGGQVMRTLGRTGIEMPIVGAGGGTGNDPSIVQACVEAGMVLFDTDARFRNGHHERILGDVFHRMRVRDRMIIMTKVHTPEQRRGLSPDQSKRLIDKTFEGCLRRLKTDYVDILLVHDVSDPGPIKDPAIMESMVRIRESGKARSIGIATHSKMTTAIKAATEAGIYDVILTSINFTMADDRALLDSINTAAARGIGMIAMKTQAGGYRFPNPGSLRDYSNAVINSAALKWACNNQNITSSIPGIINYEHLRSCLAVASDPEYTDEERRFLADNRIKLSMEFCRQCGRCLPGCPSGVDIPALMRTHMYAVQYGNFEMARQTLNTIYNDKGVAVCGICDECTAKCVNSVNISRKIDELKTLYA